MYDIKWIRENAEVFDCGRKRRGLDPLAGKLLALDDARRAAIAKCAIGARAAQCSLEGNWRRDEGGRCFPR